MIPFLDLSQIYKDSTYRAELDRAWHRVMTSGNFIMGPELAAFENEFAQYTGAKHCIGVANGLDALQLILRAYNIGPGDEVIVPAQTFIATWLAVSLVGATPVGVDVTNDTCTLDVAKLDRAFTNRTKAIIAVHLFGHPANMADIIKFADSKGLFVFEDAAQAHGASINKTKCGTLGHAAAWSMYPGKNLGAMGDGGAITTNDSVIAKRILKIRNYGSSVKYCHDTMGINSRLDELQAALLRVRLARLDNENAHRAALANVYCQRLAGCSKIIIPCTVQDVDPSWHLFVIRVPNRREVIDELHNRSIIAQIHYPTLPHCSGVYFASHGVLDFPVASNWANNCLSLPLSPFHTTDDINRVCDALLQICQ